VEQYVYLPGFVDKNVRVALAEAEARGSLYSCPADVIHVTERKILHSHELCLRWDWGFG